MGGIVFTLNRNTGNWERQVPEHSDGELTALLVDGTRDQRVAQLEKGGYDVFILNVEALVYLKEHLLSRSWPFIIIDESTTIKNHIAQRTRTAWKMKSPIRRIMTGLPNPNSPLDLFAQFTFLDPFIFGGNFNRFKDRFAKTVRLKGPYGYFNKITGFKNLPELFRIIEPFSSQVGEDVLGLPPRTYINIDVPLEGAVLKHYMDVRNELRTWWGNGDELKARMAITQIIRLAQIAGGTLQEGERVEWIEDNPKVLACDDVLAETLASPKEKAVIFCIYRAEIEALTKRYKKYGARAIYGGVTREESDKAWQDFQRDGDTGQLMIAQSHTGGLGIDLYKARTAIYYTRDFSLEAYKQSQKRLHRLGQTGTVRIIHLISRLPRHAASRPSQSITRGRESIDEVIGHALVRKAQLAGRLMTKAFTSEEMTMLVNAALQD